MKKVLLSEKKTLRPAKEPDASVLQVKAKQSKPSRGDADSMLTRKVAHVQHQETYGRKTVNKNPGREASGVIKSQSLESKQVAQRKSAQHDADIFSKAAKTLPVDQFNSLETLSNAIEKTPGRYAFDFKSDPPSQAARQSTKPMRKLCENSKVRCSRCGGVTQKHYDVKVKSTSIDCAAFDDGLPVKSQRQSEDRYLCESNKAFANHCLTKDGCAGDFFVPACRPLSSERLDAHSQQVEPGALRECVDSLATSPQVTSRRSEDRSLQALETSFLVPSLFAFVPPFLSFSSDSHGDSAAPKELRRILRFRVSNITPKVVRLVLKRTGLVPTSIGNDWIGVWGRHLRAHLFKTIRAHQKINHLPGSFAIGRKDSLWRNVNKLMRQHGQKSFGFVPKTYLFPTDQLRLKDEWQRCAADNAKWIIKPPARSRGVGIRLIENWEDLPKRKKWIVQRYIERPLLINGKKFDMRLYALVTSMNPLRIYMYKNGLARFATEPYNVNTDSLSVRCMHLTNYSVNRHAANFATSECVDECDGSKWSLKTLYRMLSDRGIDVKGLRSTINTIVNRTIIAGELSMVAQCKYNLTSNSSAYELFGFDILLDEETRPWLLEVNISPSLSTGTAVDMAVKAPLVEAVFNTVLFNLPPRINLREQLDLAHKLSLPVPFRRDVSREASSSGRYEVNVDPDFSLCYDKRLFLQELTDEELSKQNFYTSSVHRERRKYLNSILEHLTPDDVRMLIRSEDELARSAPLERIFPTRSSYKYFKYFSTLRYYNSLLDAWEHRYGDAGNDSTARRAEGIALLQALCAKKYHLPAKPADTTKAKTSRD